MLLVFGMDWKDMDGMVVRVIESKNDFSELKILCAGPFYSLSNELGN